MLSAFQRREYFIEYLQSRYDFSLFVCPFYSSGQTCLNKSEENVPDREEFSSCGPFTAVFLRTRTRNPISFEKYLKIK